MKISQSVFKTHLTLKHILTHYHLLKKLEMILINKGKGGSLMDGEIQLLTFVNILTQTVL